MISSVPVGIISQMITNSDRSKLVVLVQEMINDDDLSHLTLKDLRSVLIHVDASLVSEEDYDEDEDSDDATLIAKYVI